LSKTVFQNTFSQFKLAQPIFVRAVQNLVIVPCYNDATVWLFVLSQNDVHLIKKEDKVGASESTLLNMLKIYPFSYGLVIQQGMAQ